MKGKDFRQARALAGGTKSCPAIAAQGSAAVGAAEVGQRREVARTRRERSGVARRAMCGRDRGGNLLGHLVEVARAF